MASSSNDTDEEELRLMKIVAARSNNVQIADQEPTPASEGLGGGLANAESTKPVAQATSNESESEDLLLMKIVATRDSMNSVPGGGISSSGNTNNNNNNNTNANAFVGTSPAKVEHAVQYPYGKGGHVLPRGGSSSLPGAYTGTGNRLQNVRYDKTVGPNDNDAAAAAAAAEAAAATVNNVPKSADNVPAAILSADVEAADATKGDTNEGPPEESRKKHLIMGVVGIGMLILVAAVLLLVFLLPGDSSDPETVAPESEKEQVSATDVMEDVLKLLPDDTLQALETKDSPQAKAYQWLTDDPALLEGTYSDTRILQRFVLATMYFALGGESWRHYRGWLEHAENECTWRGLECQTLNDESSLLHTIVLPKNRMEGTLPEELCLLSDIANIDLQDNAIHGSIPFCLSLTIILDGNDDVMSISPTQIGLLSNLKVINFPLFGPSIPSEVGLLTALESISLSQKDLRGKIPSELGNLVRLHTLDLSSNELSGNVPSELGNLKRLHTLDLSYNLLSGSIPSEVGNLKSLLKLGLSETKLSGSIPSELGRLTILKVLDLAGSTNVVRRGGFGGSIPSELGGLILLEELQLKNNIFNGTIPLELGSLQALREVDLDGNDLTGSVPSELGGLNLLNKLALSRNEFTGSVPSELGSPQKLSQIYLRNNDLSGSIPSELGGLNSLNKLDLSWNDLSGSIPSELGSPQNMTRLDLQKNDLSGSIPSELGQITLVYLSNNRLTGRVPEELDRAGVKVGGNANLTSN